MLNVTVGVDMKCKAHHWIYMILADIGMSSVRVDSEVGNCDNFNYWFILDCKTHMYIFRVIKLVVQLLFCQQGRSFHPAIWLTFAKIDSKR